MRSWYLLLGILLAAACNRGDDGEVRTAIPLTYLTAEEAIDLVMPHRSDDITVSVSKGLGPLGVAQEPDEPTTLVLSGPDARVNQLAHLIRQADRPANVQLRFQIIEANGFTSTDSAIADVDAALRDLFRFRGYRLVGESLVQSEAPGNVMQQIVSEGGRPFQIRARVQRILRSDSARAVSLELELAEAGLPLLGTRLTMPSGQTVVVGTARSGREGNTLILVVRPRIE